MTRSNSGLSTSVWLLLAVPFLHACELLGDLPWDHLQVPGDPDPDPLDAGGEPDPGLAADAGADADAAPVAEHDANAPAEDATPGLDACCEAPDAAPPPDASSEADAAPPPDASPEADAAPPDASPEAGASDCDGGVCAQPCAHDDQCAPEQYCSQRRGTCWARCDSAGACMGPEIATVNNWLVSDGAHVCYVVPEQADGGSRYLVRSWDGVAAEPRTIGSGTDVRVLLVADGYCYFSAPALMRAPVGGGHAQRVQEHAAAVRRAWLTPDHVWWTAPSAGGFDVYRLARTAGACAELFMSAPATHLWEAGNSTHLFRRAPVFGSCSVVMAPIADPSAEISTPMAFSRNCSGMLSADEQSVFYNQYEPVRSYRFRIDVADPTREIQTGLSSAAGAAVQAQQVGGFLYGTRARDGGGRNPDLLVYYPYTLTFHRVPRFGEPSPEQIELVFAPVPTSALIQPSPDRDVLADGFVGGYGNGFAVLGTRLVFLSAQEPRLMVARLPEAPP